MIKIYFDNKPLIITDNADEVADLLHRPTTISVDELDSHVVKMMIYEMEQRQFDAGVFLHPEPAVVLDAFIKKFQLIKAAGGLVYTPAKEFLLIFRRGKWDLPKGKLDENEDIQTCAAREVEEETGVGKLEILQPLITTYHTYHEKSVHVLKLTEWFLMKAPHQELQPQTDEDIEACQWTPMEEVSTRLENSYGLIHDVFEEGKKASSIT